MILIVAFLLRGARHAGLQHKRAGMHRRYRAARAEHFVVMPLTVINGRMPRSRIALKLRSPCFSAA
jgi:hypothetical protein